MSLTGRTVLISPSVTRAIAAELERYGARAVTWPPLAPGRPQSFAALDESIDNLFGYDWLILRNFNAADFFLNRLRELGRDVSELDSLRVCGIGEATIQRLDTAQVHYDVNQERLSSKKAFSAIEAYAGGLDSLTGLNFLIPRAAISGDFLAQTLADARARVDEVTAYRTCAAANSELAQIRALLSGGGVDCVAFAAGSEVLDLAALLDTNDLDRLVAGSVVACIDQGTAEMALEFGLRADTLPAAATTVDLARAVSECLSQTGR